MTAADLVTLFLCLALLSQDRPATDREAGYLAYDRDRADTFWAAAEWLGATKPAERPWWVIRQDRRDWPDPVWAHRAEIASIRARLHRPYPYP